MEITDPRRSANDAALVFEEYLARLDAGEAVELDALIAERPDLGARLRELKRDFDSFRVMAGELKRKLGEREATEQLGDVDPEDASDLLSDLEHRIARDARYPVQTPVARGGMGQILRVWDAGLRRHIAMKVVAPPGHSGDDVPSADARSIRRFLSEAEISARLDHPGVIPIHELGIDAAGRIYFTMRWVQGRTLHDVFDDYRRRDPAWPLTRVLRALLSVCETMAYAHSQRVIHRDLKPSNIMIGEFGEVHVLDWGIARTDGAADPHDLHFAETERAGGEDDPLRTMDGVALGTPSYMSPEQARGAPQEMGPRSDVYAVGAMLYHLLTGTPPYGEDGRATTSREILSSVIDGPPTPVASLAGDAPPAVLAICEKAIARRASDRYQQMLDLAADLRAYLDGRVVRAFRTGAVAELSTWVRRNRIVAATSLGALLSLMVALTITLFVERRAGERVASERDVAEQSAYTANLAAATASLDAWEVPEARRRLADTAPRLRGWEWRHLRFRTDASERSTHAGDGPVEAAALLPDDGGLLIATGDGAIRTLRLDDGEVRVLGRRDASLGVDGPAATAVGVPPAGPIVAAGFEDGLVLLIERPSGSVRHELPGPRGRVQCLVYSPDGETLLVSSIRGDESRLEIFDADTAVRRHAVELGTTGWPVPIAFVDDDTVACDMGERALALVDLRTARVLEVVAGQGEGLYAIALAPNRGLLATADRSNMIRVFDTTSWEQTLEVAAPRPVRSLAFDALGTSLAFAGHDRMLHILDPETGEARRRLGGHTDRITSVLAVGPGPRLATASLDGSVRLWEPDRAVPVRELQLDDGWVLSAAFSRDGRLAAGTQSGALHLYDRDGLPHSQFRPAGEGWVWSVAWHPLGAWVAAGTGGYFRPAEGLVTLISAETGESLAVLRGHEDAVRAIAVHPDGTRLVTGSLDGTIRVWSAPEGRELRVMRGHDQGVRGIALDSEGRRVLSASMDGTVRMWDLSTGAMLRTFSGHREWVHAVAFSPDGRRFVSAGGGANLSVITECFVWDVETGERLFALDGHGMAVVGVAFSPDGRRIATASEDTTVRLWDTDGVALLTLRGHDRWVRALAWSPDGQRLATGGADGRLRLWDSGE